MKIVKEVAKKNEKKETGKGDEASSGPPEGQRIQEPVGSS